MRVSRWMRDPSLRMQATVGSTEPGSSASVAGPARLCCGVHPERWFIIDTGVLREKMKKKCHSILKDLEAVGSRVASPVRVVEPVNLVVVALARNLLPDGSLRLRRLVFLAHVRLRYRPEGRGRATPAITDRHSTPVIPSMRGERGRFGEQGLSISVEAEVPPGDQKRSALRGGQREQKGPVGPSRQARHPPAQRFPRRPDHVRSLCDTTQRLLIKIVQCSSQGKR